GSGAAQRGAAGRTPRRAVVWAPGLPLRNRHPWGGYDEPERTANLAQPCGSEEFVRHAGAGSVLAQYGLMMGGLFHERFAVDYAPLAEALLLKALELDTANARWPTALEQFRNLRQEVGRAK